MAFITITKNPKVSIIKGAEKNSSIGFIKVLITVKIKAALSKSKISPLKN
jgi:hypothetical protein